MTGRILIALRSAVVKKKYIKPPRYVNKGPSSMASIRIELYITVVRAFMITLITMVIKLYTCLFQLKRRTKNNYFEIVRTRILFALRFFLYNDCY